MLDLEFLRSRLQGLALGWPLHYAYRTTSTQDEARAAALAGAAEGLLVLAEEQTAGRGRAGRSWWAPPGSAILSSLLLRPTFLPSRHMAYLGMIAGLAVCDTLEELAGLSPVLKWPNDILLGDKKVGGILVEALWNGDAVSAVILGLGLNVNTYFPPHHPLATIATSLAAETGHQCAREPLIYGYVYHLGQYYHRLQEGWSPLNAWQERLITLGRPVRVDEGSRSWEGIAEAVTEEGALVIRRGSERVLLHVGDVSVRHT